MSVLDSKKFYYQIAILTTVVVFIEIVLGSYVKSTGAGLSCPDWPLCYNQLIPINYSSEFRYTQVLSEYIHRLTATLVSFLLILMAYLTFKNKNEQGIEGFPIGQRRFRLMILILFLLAIQVILGGLTVLMDLHPDIVSFHLGNAVLIFGASVFLLANIYPHANLGKTSNE